MILYQLSEATAAQRRVFLHLVDATDGITPETGEGAGQPQVSKNGAAFANTTATLTHVANGHYYVELTAAELNTVGVVSVRFKSAATAEAQVINQVVPWDPYDAVRQGMTALPNAAAEAAGGLYTRGTGAGQINQNANGQIDSRTVAMAADVITAAAIATAAIDADALAANAITAAKIAADAITAAKVADGTIDAATFAAGAINAAAIATDAITAAKIAANAITAAKIAAAAITVTQAPTLDAAMSTRATPAQVNSQVSDVLKVDTIAELSQAAPDATPTFENALMALYMALRNKLDVTSGFKEIHDDAGVVIFKKALSDNGTVYSEAEAETGP